MKNLSISELSENELISISGGDWLADWIADMLCVCNTRTRSIRREVYNRDHGIN